jgi:Transglycosylase SLT domain
LRKQQPGLDDVLRIVRVDHCRNASETRDARTNTDAVSSSNRAQGSSRYIHVPNCTCRGRIGKLGRAAAKQGRRYGLAVTSGNDERLDVLKATRAAARYLRDLHGRFASWPLTLAAYNAGEEAVQRAIDHTGASDFSELGRSLPPETRKYVPAVIAAAQRIGADSRILISGPRQG